MRRIVENRRPNWVAWVLTIGGLALIVGGFRWLTPEPSGPLATNSPRADQPTLENVAEPPPVPIRPTRFLNAAADTNMRIANCTTAAQYFHLLRRQAMLLSTDPLPLVVMTPKSLLRHPFTASTPAELAEGSFQAVIDDASTSAAAQAAKVRRVAFCSGKVAVDLLTSDRRTDNPNVAVVRVEQLYPFPSEAIGQVIDRYPKLREVCWVQEEPENMGAWEFARPELETIINGRHPLRYIGRSRNSSPSEGSSSWHAANQRAIVDQVFEAKTEARDLDLRERDGDDVAALAPDQLALGEVLAEVLLDHAAHDLPEALHVPLDLPEHGRHRFRPPRGPAVVTRVPSRRRCSPTR